MYRARNPARSGELKGGSFRAKSLWSPSVPKAGPNSPDTSKARFARDICEIAVGTLITERPPHRTVRAQFGHTAPTLGV